MNFKLIKLAMFAALSLPATLMAENQLPAVGLAQPSPMMDENGQPMVMVNGLPMAEEDVPEEWSTRVSGSQTGIGVFKGDGGTSAFIFAWGDGGIEVTGLNGVISATTQDSGHGVIGVSPTLTATGAGVYGLSFSASGAGVRGYNADPNGYGVYSDGKAYIAGDLNQATANTGVVKAWAKVNADGTLHSNYKCGWVTKDSVGNYIVDCDIEVLSRPKSVTLESHSTWSSLVGVAVLGNPVSFPPAPTVVGISTYGLNSVSLDLPFTLLIY